MNPLDAVIAFVSPEWGASRAAARATMAQINSFGAVSGGFSAGKTTRLTPRNLEQMVKTNAVPADQTSTMVARSWALYRDNPYARKIVSSLQSKVIGSGMRPEPLATNEDGSPNTLFRSRAKLLWESLQSSFDYRGDPGHGGQTFSGLQRLALRMAVLSGQVFYRLIQLSPQQWFESGGPVPLRLQLIDSSRLACENDLPTGRLASGHQFYRGIELDSEGQRVAYWFNSCPAGSANHTNGTATRYPAAEIGHLFIEDDLDQYIGTPWFSAAILSMRDTGDLQYNVLKSSAMAACVIGSYAKPTGAARFGLNASSEARSDAADGTDLTDSDGNAITKLQPAMIINTGKDGAFQLHSPNQPTMNPEAFIQHMLRGVAAGLPGIKSSTVTGDYRNSSFSSEKSSDNDTWPEIEAIQEWFASSFCQPIWEAVVRSAVDCDYFGSAVIASEFKTSLDRFTLCRWQGPIGRSINPTDDADAAGRRMQLGLSSLQQECAKVGTSWRDVISDAAELFQAAEVAGLPAEVVNNILGVGANDVIAQTNKNNSDTEKEAVPVA